MPGLGTEDMGFLSYAFSKSALIDSNFFYFTSLPIADRVERAQISFSQTKMGNSLYRSQTVRQYADVSAQLCKAINKNPSSNAWLIELTQAPLLSESLTSGCYNFSKQERDALRQYADRVLTEGADDGAPAALHHQNCLRILAGDLPKQMANRMILMLSYHGQTLDKARADHLAELYEGAGDLNFAQLRNQALQIEALHQTLDQCRDIKAGNASQLAASFSSLNEQAFENPLVQDFYVAFRENYFARHMDFQQALAAATEEISTRVTAPAQAQDNLPTRSPR